MSAWILTSPQTNHKPANFSDPPFQNLGFKLVSPQQKQKRWGKVVCVCGGRGEGGEVVECQLRTSKSGVWLDQNWMFVDRGEEGVGVQTLDFLADVINKWTLANSFLLFNMIFCFFFSLYSLSFIAFFIALHIKQKR